MLATATKAAHIMAMRIEPALRREKLTSAAAVLLIHILLGYLLVAGLSVDLPHMAERSLALFDLAPPPAPPKPPPPRSSAKPKAPKREGAASPPNLKAEPAPVVAPVPIVVLPPPPPPVIAAPIAGEGAAPSAGAALVKGPGTGSGGVGEGRGSGDSGDGPGGGGGDGGRPLRLISGRLNPSDYPRAALAAAAQGTVYLRFTVGVKGRVTDCTVTRSSGNADLDETTCRLIKQRLRYRPTLDARGRPVPDVVTGEHEWMLWER